ncbi:hypothetical protein RI129_000647 [Pyrocoelia pectoralis]|uniref:Tesmin/TSO1-like CXC domain-containing protein n=1 Tax=Pyrocoelia pectoralis TaxID=417401 RepID=A0AAN7VUQ7_9COLE
MIAQAGERFFIALYGGNKTELSIDSLRNKNFGKLARNTKLNLAILPPTQDAVRYHSFRVYYQVQSWLGFHHDPEEWGWKRAADRLSPIRMKKAPAPQNLLQIISCKCKTNCGAACGCRTSGLKCSIICSNCSGQTCDNAIPTVDDSDEEDVENESFIDSFAVSDLNMEEENSQIENRPSCSKQRKLF